MQLGALKGTASSCVHNETKQNEDTQPVQKSFWSWIYDRLWSPAEHSVDPKQISLKAQAIHSSLQKSQLFDIEMGDVEALVKKAFQIQEIATSGRAFPDSFWETDHFRTCEIKSQSGFVAHVKCRKKTQTITLSLRGRLVDFCSHIVTCGLMDEALKAHAQSIHDYVVANKECFCAQAQAMGSGVYRRPKESNQCRAFLFTSNNETIVFLNRKRRGDGYLSEGEEKTVVMAMNIATAQLFVSTSFKNAGDREVALLRKFKGVKGIVQMHHEVSYPDKKDKSLLKTRVVLELYNEGDLFDKVYAEQTRFWDLGLCSTGRVLVTGDIDGITLEDKKQVTSDLVGALAFIHEEGYAHRDVKPENMFVFRKSPKEPLSAVLGDLSFARHKDDKKDCEMKGSLSWLSPELAQFALSCKNDKPPLTLGAQQKGDVWALGVALYLLFGPFQCPWMGKEEQLSPKEILQMIVDTDEWPEPPDPNSPVYLAWMMMRKDPTKRISTQDALKQLPHLRWS